MATPNLNLALQVRDAPNWDVPNNANFTTLDTVVGGGTVGNVLTSNGPNTAPTYQPVSAPPGTGTVTSVALTAPAEFSVAGSPITAAGILAITKATQSANLVYAGPAAGGAAQPTFRALTAADLPFTLYTQLALPGWWMCCDGSNYPFDGSNGQFSSGTANVPQWWMIRVPYAIAIRTATFRFNGAGVGGVGGMSVYDSTGQTKIVSFDNFAFSGGAGPKTIIATGGLQIILPPSIYVVACAQSVTGASATTQGGYKTQGSSDVTNGWNANGTPRSGIAANPMVAGVLPASLGLLSISASAPPVSLPCVCFEP